MTKHLMAAAALLMGAGMTGAQAQDYPTRTVTIIIPFAAGGPADITGRIVADIFNRHLGQKFVVENVGGAGRTSVSFRDLYLVLTAFNGDQIVCEWDPLLGTLMQVQAGLVNVLVVASSNRSPMLPDVPTFYKQGLPEFDCAPFYAEFLPRGTPQ